MGSHPSDIGSTTAAHKETPPTNLSPPHSTLPLTRASVQSAHILIKPYIHRTPVLTSSYLNALASQPQDVSALVGTPWEGQEPARPKMNFFFKCENFQKIGAFKIRGATHALARLLEEEGRENGRCNVNGSGGGLKERGVVTHSSGNHAQALALASRTFGVPAHIVMPTISTPTKIAATKSYGATVHFSGSTSQERDEVASRVQAETGAIFIPPYDFEDIILGQGTMALELEEQAVGLIEENPALSVHGRIPTLPIISLGDTREQEGQTEHQQQQQQHPPHTLDAVIAPLGGGGMLSGIATALHHTPSSTSGPIDRSSNPTQPHPQPHSRSNKVPKTRVYGAEPSHSGADDGRRGLLSNPPKRIPHVSSLTIADGLRTPLGEINWRIISNKQYVEGVYAVSDSQIKRAMRLCMERLKIVVEPSAVVGLAVALWDEEFRRVVQEEGAEEGWDVGIVLSGGNVSVDGLVALFTTETSPPPPPPPPPPPSTTTNSSHDTTNPSKAVTEPETVSETGSSTAKIEREREKGTIGIDGRRDVEDVAG